MDRKQNDFAARLKRIEAKGGDKPKAPEADSGGGDYNFAAPPIRSGSGGGGGGMGIVGYGMILTLLVGVGGLGTLYMLNAKAQSAGEQVAEVAETSAAPVTEPAAVNEPEQTVASVLDFKVDHRKGASEETYTKERGWRYGTGRVLNAGGAELNLADLVSGYDPAVEDGAPRDVAMFDPNPACTLRRPEPGEVVHNVRLESGAGYSELHIVSDEDLAKGVSEHLTGLTQLTGKKYMIGKTARGNLDRVDVLVTDTSAPVYLVLQSMYGNTLWNVHRGPGVQIAHIAMIGNSSGLAAPEGIGFEAVRISDFVDPGETNFKRMGAVNFTGTDDHVNANETVRPCMVVPYRAPEPDWHATAAAEKGSQLYINQINTFASGHAAFAAWYSETLGMDPNANLVSAEWAQHVLVGPVPASPLGYRQIADQSVRLVRNDNVYRSDRDLIEAHRALLTAAAGGDAAAIDPAPMELAAR